MCRLQLESGIAVLNLNKSLALLPIVVALLTASAARGSSASSAEPQLLVMAPITVPIVGSDRLDGSLRMKLVIAASDPTALANLTERVPELRAVSVAGAIEFSRLYASARTPVNAVQLRAALTAALKADNPSVADVLIVEISAVA